MGAFIKYRNFECPPGPPFNVGGEKRARSALASQTFSSTLIGGQGGRLTKAAQSDQCSRSLDRDAHQISHSVHLFSHFFATIDCSQSQRHLGGMDVATVRCKCNGALFLAKTEPLLMQRCKILPLQTSMLGGESRTNDSHCNSIFARYLPVLNERSQCGLLLWFWVAVPILVSWGAWVAMSARRGTKVQN